MTEHTEHTEHITVQIKRNPTEYNLSVTDILDGCAYESEDRTIYIGNYQSPGGSTSNHIFAFSICGDHALVRSDTDTKLRSIMLEVNVK